VPGYGIELNQLRQIRLALVAALLLLVARSAGALTIGPQVPLAASQTYTLTGDFVAAGVGMRNVGSGTITLPLPQGALVLQAFLYWAIIDTDQPAATAMLNGQPVAGSLIAQTGDACWPNQNAAVADPPTIFTWVFRADVTAAVASGENQLAAFPSGLTGGEDPLNPIANASAFPLLDGASLVAVYVLPGAAQRSIVLYDGGQAFVGQSVTTSLAFGSKGAISPVSARSAWIVADGQGAFPDDQAGFNGTIVAGPTSNTKPNDAFDGADGGGPTNPQGLWDTLVLDVSSLVSPGDTSGTASVVSGDKLDCLTWVAQVVSVQVDTTTTTTSTTGTTSTSTTTGSTSTTTSTTTTTVPTTTTASTSTTTSSTVTTTSSTPSTTTTSTSTTTASTTSSTSTSSSTTSSTTTTTTATSSTSTTTSSSTTTTAVATTSTSTTLPGGDCEGLAGFEAILCRLRVLTNQVTALPSSHARDLLLARLRRAVTQVQNAESRAELGKRRTTLAALRAAARDLVTFAYRAQSLLGRVTTDQGASLAAEANDIRTDVLALEGSF